MSPALGPQSPAAVPSGPRATLEEAAPSGPHARRTVTEVHAPVVPSRCLRASRTRMLRPPAFLHCLWPWPRGRVWGMHGGHGGFPRSGTLQAGSHDLQEASVFSQGRFSSGLRPPAPGDARGSLHTVARPGSRRGRTSPSPAAAWVLKLEPKPKAALWVRNVPSEEGRTFAAFAAGTRWGARARSDLLPASGYGRATGREHSVHPWRRPDADEAPWPGRGR